MHKYGVIPQEADGRDFKAAIFEAAALPDKVDLRYKCPPVFDQGSLGSCTANAGAGAYMMLAGEKEGLSRLFLYYQERVLEGTVSEDAGATMRSIGKALNKFGICSEPLWPYITDKFDDDPPDKADTDAAGRKISAYRSISGIEGIKKYLAAKEQPVMIGIQVYESFESEAVAKTGVVPAPDTGKDELLGGHAVLIVGYDDNFNKKAGGFLPCLLGKLFETAKEKDGYFIFRNSWGADWGDGVYGYMPYSFVKKHAFDFWVIE